MRLSRFLKMEGEQSISWWVVLGGWALLAILTIGITALGWWDGGLLVFILVGFVTVLLLTVCNGILRMRER